MTSLGTKPNLNAEFPLPSYDDWRKLAEDQLGGAPFDKKLVTPKNEGFAIQPIYQRSDIADMPHLVAFPGEPGSPRGSSASGYLGNPFTIFEELPFATPQEFNRAVLADLNRGLTGVAVTLDIATAQGEDPDSAGIGEVGACGVSLATHADVEALLEGIYLEAVELHIHAGALALPPLAMLRAVLEKQKARLASVRGGLFVDPLALLARAGSLPAPLETLLDDMAESARWASGAMPEFRIGAVSSIPYAEAGANAVDEIAFVLATGAEYLREMTTRGMTAEEAASQLNVRLAIGADFFMEISKIRALRMVWAHMLGAFGVSVDKRNPSVHARTGFYNKSVRDPYVNMLRTTTEAFSAAIAGVDSLTVGAFDEVIRVPDVFSRRVARNQAVIIQEECNLGRIADPSGGSYLIETETQEIATRAWEAFQRIEADGGMTAALQTGTVQKRCADAAAGRVKRFGQRRSVLVGVNQYANLAEKPLRSDYPDYASIRAKRAKDVAAFRLSSTPEEDEATLKHLNALADADTGDRLGPAAAAFGGGASLGEVTRSLRYARTDNLHVQSLKIVRLAARYEAFRAAAGSFEKRTGSAPKIFLANLGPLKKHKLRADWITEFFIAGGFDMVMSKAFETAVDAAEAALASEANITVVCGTDDDYPILFPDIARSIKAQDPGHKVLLAGFPGDHENAFREAGMDDFVFIKSPHAETLEKYLKHCGAL